MPIVKRILVSFIIMRLRRRLCVDISIFIVYVTKDFVLNILTLTTFCNSILKAYMMVGYRYVKGRKR